MVPDYWKQAEIIPHHKKDSQLEKVNCTPVTVLTAIHKIFEHILHQQLADQFENVFHSTSGQKISRLPYSTSHTYWTMEGRSRQTQCHWRYSHWFEQGLTVYHTIYLGETKILWAKWAKQRTFNTDLKIATSWYIQMGWNRTQNACHYHPTHKELLWSNLFSWYWVSVNNTSVFSSLSRIIDHPASNVRNTLNNYSLKSRWIIFLKPLFSEVEKNNCFSIYTRSDLKKIREETIKKYDLIDRSGQLDTRQFKNRSL